MSIRTLEKEILVQARKELNNPDLKMKDILQWSTGDIGTEDDALELVINLPNPGCNICVLRKHDKRRVGK